jgi:hypothetical protein
MLPSFLRPETVSYASIEIIRADVPAPVVVCAYCPTFDPTVAPAPGTSHGICPACVVKFERTAPITVPERFRDLPLKDSDRPCAVCGLRAGFHYDGWDGNYLGCDEAAHRHGRVTHVQAAATTQAERAAFHLLLTHPATAARLDAMLADNARIDEQLREDDRLEDEREGQDGNRCGPGCSFCGRCN